MGNISFNPISALTRATLAAMCRHPGTRELVTNMMAETLEVARRVGAHPDISIERRLAVPSASASTRRPPSRTWSGASPWSWTCC